MVNIIDFLFHHIIGRVIDRAWRSNNFLNASTLLHQRYRIAKVHELGRDNPVYLAHDERQDVDVAIKENAKHDAAHRKQFELEATILANLTHPGIPRAFDYFVEDGYQFLVMDYIEGINLQQLVQQRKPDTGEILNWAGQMCDILSHLHSHSPVIIHRDVEPSNIILTINNEIFLVDFGFAKLYKPEKETVATAKSIFPKSIRVNDRIITNDQMAKYDVPAVTNPRSDQYSLAATLYYLLTGAIPVDSLQRVFKETALASIRPSRPDLPASTEEAIFRALSIEPNKRFSDIESFKSALGI
jgi:serine/threonine protein kinase